MTTTQPSQSAPVVRAIDVGFGLVKHSMRGAGAGVTYNIFPSMAIPADPQAKAMLGARRRDTFDVPVKGALYEVGREVVIAQTGNEYGRQITDEFYRGPVYEALTLGAMRYMAESGDTTIDQLVVGLPANHYLEGTRREFLQRLFAGRHDLGDGKFIEVLNVIVVAQPMGGYVELGNQLEGLNAAISEIGGPLGAITDLDAVSVLMVDPGEYTLDWLLLQNGSLTNKASGAASDAGHHRVVRAVHEALQADLKRPLGPAAAVRINEALRAGKPLHLLGEAIDLAQYDGVVRAAVADLISRLVDGLLAMQDFVDVIALVGGNPDRYRDALRERFPRLPIYIVQPSVEANVRGFQAFGEEAAAMASRRAA